MRILFRLLAFLLIFAAVSGGLLYGHALGARGQGQAARQRVGHLFAFPRPESSGTEQTFQQPDESVPPVNVFEDVLDHVQKEFVENNSTNNARLNNGALARMFASLDDPHTFYLDPPLRKARQEALQGVFHGIGAVLTVTRTRRADVEYRHLTVVDTMPGSPAEQAGIQAGDNISEVNGHWVIAYSPLADEQRIVLKNEDEASRRTELKQVVTRFQRGVSLSTALPLLIEGEAKPLKLTLDRPGAPATIKVQVTTARTQVVPVEFRIIANRIGCLRVRQFNAAATKKLADVLHHLPSDVHGLIVDLRGCPGGVQAETGDTADGLAALKTLLQSLTPGGTVALLERRSAAGKHPAIREPLTVAIGANSLPLAVLVDHGTANLAELAALSLQKQGGAKVVGSHTFGDDILPFFAALHGGGGVEMTTAHLLTGSGISLKSGLEPDVTVMASAQRGDAVLSRAVALLEGFGK